MLSRPTCTTSATIATARSRDVALTQPEIGQLLRETERMTPVMQTLDADLRQSDPAAKALFINLPWWNAPNTSGFLIGAEGMPIYQHGDTQGWEWLYAYARTARETKIVYHPISETRDPNWNYGHYGEQVDDNGLRACVSLRNDDHAQLMEFQLTAVSGVRSLSGSPEKDAVAWPTRMGKRIPNPAYSDLSVYAGFRKHGLHYLKNSLVIPGVPWPLHILLIPLEFLSTFILRPITLALRLLMNMVAGHMLLVLCFTATNFFFFTVLANGQLIGLLGIGTFETLRPAKARELNIPESQGGLLVGNVTASGPVGTAGLKAGDVIIRLGNTEIASENDLMVALIKNSANIPNQSTTGSTSV